MFSAATGLKINYDKSTITPMHLPEGALEEFLGVLSCKVGSFPQIYLGLPLSNVKLPLSAFAPLIARIDRYLATWQALLLATAGRVVLVNTVLTGVRTYAMGAMLLPPGVLAAIDARRRAFLWTGSDHTSGAKCLVAWENVCRAKEDGGLGVKRLDTQNACLLLKLIHRLHHPHGSSWAMWAREGLDLSGDLDGTHWAAIRNLLPAHHDCLGRERGCNILLARHLAHGRAVSSEVAGALKPLQRPSRLRARRRRRRPAQLAATASIQPGHP